MDNKDHFATRVRGVLTRNIQFMWLVEKLEKAQVCFKLDFEDLRDRRNSKGWNIHMVFYMTTSG